MIKSGLKTTEFWLTIVANLLVDSGAFPVPDKYKALTAILTTIGYALSRGLAKQNPVTGVTQVTR